MDLAARAKKLSPSLTLEVKAKADKLKEKGLMFKCKMNFRR